MAVNCGAIPQALMNSEHFGHIKGAFTGAMAEKKGKFERAKQGTLFLDEVGELPLEIQIRLLRIIQNGELEKVGSEKSIPLDLRLVAATHRDLADMVAKGTFRKDLWFRLNVFPISIPPLRERPKDIPLLVKHFLRQKARLLKLDKIPGLASGAMDNLMNHWWPGNVRVLENAIEREMILSEGENLKFHDLLDSQKHSAQSLSLEDTIAKHILKVLAMTEGQVYGPQGAAEILKINPSTLRNKMDKLGIPYGRSYLNK